MIVIANANYPGHRQYRAKAKVRGKCNTPGQRQWRAKAMTAINFNIALGLKPMFGFHFVIAFSFDIAAWGRCLRSWAALGAYVGALGPLLGPT